MKLLFDNNVSHKLVARLDDIFPDSTHVMMENMDESEDEQIWAFAKANGYTIVTKDADYNEMSLINHFPPKVIWIRIGNCKISEIERIIRRHAIVLNKFRHYRDRLEFIIGVIAMLLSA